MTLSTLVAGYDHLLLDLDGCVRLGREPTPGARDAIEALRAAGRRVAFVTNDAIPTPEEVVRELWHMGIRASMDEVVTVGGAVQHVLAETAQWRAAYVIGSPAIHRHVADAGTIIVNGRDLPAADVVVVAAHERFDYTELRFAVKAVLAGAALVTAGRDATYPMPDAPWPGTGAVIAAIETATGAVARNVGKPDAQLFHTALDRLGPGRALVVGDRLDSDLAGAHAAGLDGAIVLSGVTTAEQAAAALRGETPPVAVGATLAELLLS